jgi:hypothetical protein
MTLEDLHRRRLPGAVGAEESKYLAARNSQVNAPDSLETVVGHPEARHLDHSIGGIHSYGAGAARWDK